MTPSRQILIHRLWRRAWPVGVFLLILTSLLDHAGAFGYRGDDWKQFDRQRVHIDQVIDDQSFTCGTTIVRLLGITANQERATSFTEENLAGRDVTLRLDIPQTRDAAGELLAYVYLSPNDCWNVDLIRNGSGEADRRTNCSMMPALLAAESERIRKAKRLKRQ